ncbi:hypothetical protein Barb7_01687 [Bacteroidales bacterium Barb7]|nr:hypothetical protein Barb7_01687 [Bacteroidales bacterium Barb7]
MNLCPLLDNQQGRAVAAAYPPVGIRPLFLYARQQVSGLRLLCGIRVLVNLVQPVVARGKDKGGCQCDGYDILVSHTFVFIEGVFVKISS